MSSFKIAVVFSILLFCFQGFATASTVTIPFKTDYGDPNNPWGNTKSCVYADSIEVGPANRFIGYNFWVKPANYGVRSAQTLPRIQNDVLFLDVNIVTVAGEWGRSDICHASILGELQIMPPDSID